MNVELSAPQRRLAATVRRSVERSEPDTDGWEVVDALGITELLMPEPGARPILGQLEWCLILEELGAGPRDERVARSVRIAVDVAGSATATTAADTFRQWARSRRCADGASPDPVARTGTARSSWQMSAGTAADAEPGPEIVLDVVAARRVADRELLATAAYAVGVGRRCLELAQCRASERVITGRRLIEYQGTSHRLARGAVDLVLARIGLWTAASGEDHGVPAGHRAAATVAACVAAALNCAHAAVQTFGAAGTHDPAITRLFRAAYEIPARCGSPRALWQVAGQRRLVEAGAGNAR
ncbi:acyl-CoA dehydrogenase family protein [Micromonospora sp. NPDC051925]|uniref:acyl-CoA dehydrogenase family protein n=1 Tax=Micromonospora sp. NPDC051925 TaxID=3364288 RepID=UPI0037C58C11